jgi:hypothetical protein
MIDLNSIDKQQVKSLLRLKEIGGEKLLEFFSDEMDRGTQKLVKATDMVEIHRLQGRVEAFEDLLRAIDESAKVANRS